MSVFVSSLILLLHGHGLEADATVVAQNDAPKVDVTFKPGALRAGGAVQGVATVTFGNGLHAYQNPPTKDHQIPVTFKSDSKGFVLTPTFPKGVMADFMGEMTALYDGTVKIPFKLKLPTKAGPYTVKFSLGYQQCNDQACFPPGSVEVTKKVTIAAAIKSSKHGG